MNILVTGFEPFGGEPINPSWEVAKALDGLIVGQARVKACQLPTAFQDAPGALRAAIESWSPRLVFALGQATGRAEISMERVAINLIDARIADNSGHRPHDQPVRADGPAAYFSTLPLKHMLAGLRAAGHPTSLSLTAGAFVCNQVFYELMHLTRDGVARSGFIHLPALPEQAARKGVNTPSMSLSAQIDAIRLALALASQGEPDRPADFVDEGAPIA